VVPFGSGFVMHNTHSLPTNADHIPGDIGGFAASLGHIPIPLRVLTPSRQYLGDQKSGTFSLARYDSLQSVLTSHVDSSLAILGFPASPRYVEPQIGPGDATDWPFFYEDKRNQFYVSIAQSFVPYHSWTGFGGTLAGRQPVASIPHIPPLTTTPFPAGGVPRAGVVNPVASQGSGAIWSYTSGARSVVAGFANQASFPFQGRIVGPAGSAPSPLGLTRSAGG